MRHKYQSSLRNILLLLLFSAATCLVKAQSSYSLPAWNGTDISSSLEGNGSIEFPYKVSSGADLKLIQYDEKYWKAGIYFLQTDDIDLGGHELGIIGYADGTSGNINASNLHPFFATYNGGGHKISNLLVYWDIKKPTADAAKWDTKDVFHQSAGLFGLLAGTVRNLHIDRAHVTRSSNAVKKDLKCDMRLGIIAGAAAPNKGGNKQVKIENIIITNSKIDDGGIDTDLKTYFLGGIVGDVSCGYGGTNNITANGYGNVFIRNIYAEIDFDLSKSVKTTTDNASITQFDIGGIVGRMRRGKFSDLPVNVLYAGKVKAPLAAVTPFICMARCNNDQNVKGMNNAYIGEVIKSKNTTNNNDFIILSSDAVTIDGEPVSPNANRYFCNYQIWDSKINDYVEINHSYPAADNNRSGIRTLDNDGSVLTTNPAQEIMRSWQGVNHGSYIDLSTNIGASSATAMLNSLNDPVKFAWDAENKTFTFTSNEQIILRRNSLHSVNATIYNSNRSTDYIYSWTLTDRDGNVNFYETTKSSAAGYSSDNISITVDESNGCKLTIRDDFRKYAKVKLTLFDDRGNSLASEEISLPEFSLTFKRSIETTDKTRYHFSPIFSLDEDDLSSDDPLLSNLSFEWNAYKWNNEQWELDNSAIYSGASSQEVVVKQEFIGSVRLVVADNEIAGKTYYLSGDGSVNYMEQVLERLRLSFNIKRIQFDSSGNPFYSPFDPTKYFTGSKGYDVKYKYDDNNTTGIHVIDQNGVSHYLAADNSDGTLNDKNVSPLVFEGTVVDQFGNILPYDPAKYKIQWSFKIPDSRSNKTYGTLEDRFYDSDSGYVIANGKTLDKIDPYASGSGIDWVGEYYRNAGNKTSQFACDRWGEWEVVDATTFKIHPNLLHCTSTFEVRAVLYDVSDASNPTSVKTSISFSQVDMDTEPVEGGYKATVSWRSGDAYTSGSLYSFKWYSNPDPTDFDGWTPVEGAGADYIANGWPNDTVKSDRRRFSVITDVDPDLFYKVEFRTASGTFIEGIMGPENVIFVYDRAKTLEHPEFHDFDFYDVQSNYYFPQGDDTNHGRDPWHAVATMSQAFKLLPDNASYKKNRIVVMGYYHEYESNSNYFMSSSWWKNNQAKATTISGAFGANIKGGTLGLGSENSSSSFDIYLRKPMRWENMTLMTYNNSNSTSNNCLYAENHDFILGRRVRMINFNIQDVKSGLPDGVSVPNFSLVAGTYDYMASNSKWENPLEKMDGDYAIKYDGNERPEITTIKILSAGIGRLIGGSRNSGNNAWVPALFGTPTNPNRVRVEIDIPHEVGKEKEFLPDWNLVNSDGTSTGSVSFTHDIGIVVGGQTDGSTFTDAEFTVRNAHISRFVAGSITFGRQITAYQHPDDSFFGRSVLNIYGGRFDELYGGSLGRSGNSNDDNIVKGFFYGQSIINLYDGIIGNSANPSAAKLFAAGAGGVIGKGHFWKIDGVDDDRKTYTIDDRIPFIKDDDSIEFRPFDENSPDDHMPKMKYIDEKEVAHEFDLGDSKVELNLYGGTIYGNVYGGGYGYASNLIYQRVPYRIIHDSKILQSLAGNLYGSSFVRLLPNPDPNKPNVVIYGNLYGAGAGDDTYLTQAAGKKKIINGTEYSFDFSGIAKTFGDTHVSIEAGHIMGDVFAGGCGIEQYSEMANTYGDASLLIKGGIIDGNIYGGSAFSDIRNYYTSSSSTGKIYAGGNSHTSISGGSIGNCIFGGGKGVFYDNSSPLNTSSNIDGDVVLEISGGSFSDVPVIETISGNIPKSFNIYGGGYINSTIRGNTHVVVESSPLVSTASIGALFSDAWNDILDRRFCIYGAGYGEHTRVLGNTTVDIDIDPDRFPETPSPDDIDHLIAGQTIFDVAGGGYSGNVGFWADKDDNPLYLKTTPDVEEFDHYVGGQLNVRIKGNPFIRKVIGGSFYAECNNTDTYIESGSIKEVYGGALMGYVHDHARLNIGSKVIDGANSSGFDAIALADSASAVQRNSRLFITGNVYGGNDVKGIVGTTFWTNDIPGSDFGKRGKEFSDGAPLFCSDVSEAINKGVTMFIHGGYIGGNVYGAGNGHYRGYYVPDWVRYNDGPDRHYRKVFLIKDDAGNVSVGKVYRCRPMTGSVTMHIGGNSEADRVIINGNIFGGGRSCTIGQWNTVLPYEDPRRLVKAGFLHINFGSHVKANSVYMGAQGDDFSRPKELRHPGMTIGDGQIPSTADLDSIGGIAYDHWYLTHDGTKYLPGFPPPGEIDGNFGMLGEHMLRAYAKNIEMNADIELTFYSNPFKLNSDNSPVMSADGSTVVCKKWLPAEKAHTDYDASDVTFNNFFGGGASGFMTNNKLMRYDYANKKPVPDISYDYYNNNDTDYGVNYNFHNDASSDIETFGTIYRFSLPPGLTILDKVVGGSEDAISSVYKYEENTDGTITLTDDKLYTFEGGMVTQCSYTYDLIVHNDKYWDGYKKNLDHAIPASHFANHNYEDSYTLQHGPDAGKTIYRLKSGISSGMKDANPNYGAFLGESRYDMAYYLDEKNVEQAYCGPRESRIDGNKTVLKLTVASQFDPHGDGADPDDHSTHYGGVIYGGCYNSGVTQGDVMVTVSSNTIGNHHDVSDPDAFGNISSLAHNIGRVFGGGYGAQSRIDGDTYVNLLLGFVGMNVFGGGCQGNVNGSAHVKYLGNENNSYVLGAIYGGGLYGAVGVRDVTVKATDVRLFSGNVDKVYGGSCLGNLYGRTNVELCDEVTTELEYFDYSKLLANNDIFDWGGSRLIVGSVFGGNDIAGTIIPQPAVTNPNDVGFDEKDLFATYVRTYETPHTGDPSNPDEGPGKQTPGAVGAFNGYPLIGYLYAGSNGNYGYHDETAGLYKTVGDSIPTVTFATGEKNVVRTLKLSGDDGNYPAFGVPNVSLARLDLEGGTVVNAYGGGDRATITKKTVINVNYQPDTDIMDARAGFISDDDFMRTWNTCHLSHTDQIDDVTELRDNGDGSSSRVFRYHIHRLFGGNDKAPMAIQPSWNLQSGHLGNVYSGGNFGAMTFFGRDDASKPLGLSLTLNSRNFHANAVYGGGRVGDIAPAVDDAFKSHETIYKTNPENSNEVAGFYGASLYINDGVIDHLYGGNDVAGNVKYGTNVQIHGAISGDVYCAGNGNYLYKYDPSVSGSEIQETFDPDLGRYFLLPRAVADDDYDAYGGENPETVERLLAINHYRPNVDRSALHIEGSKAPDTTDSNGEPVEGEISYAYVRGNVYCGGNSSTVGVGALSNTDGINFDIGKYVILNGVFLGSNGENLVDPNMMQAFEKLNGINLADSYSKLSVLSNYDKGFASHDKEVVENPDLFPHLLDVYMRAVDVYGTPADFKMNPANIEESYIGDFFVGGNRGSMLSDKTISLTFPHDLVIFGKIVGGSNNANVTYREVTHTGGLTRKMTDPDADKIYLQILSKFEPWKMTYPAKNQLSETDYRFIKMVPDVEWIGEKRYFPESKCSVFGGCFNSGRTVGNIHIDLYSDLAGEYAPSTEIYKQMEEQYHIGAGDGDKSKERIIINGIDNLQRRSFALIGAGFGRETSVLGNIRLHMLPVKFHPDFKSGFNESPSAATIFAGSEKGEVTGNTEITVRDGVVLSNLYGGSESSTLYGSTNIIIGWPQYFICQKTGHYVLDRTDKNSRVAKGKLTNAPQSGNPDPIKKDIWLCKGDYVSVNLYRQLDHQQPPELGLDYSPGNPYGVFTDSEGLVAFKYVADDTPDKYAAHNNSPYIDFHDITWDDINIYIGNNKSRLNDRSEYFAHGNIYGGGFISANSGTELAGKFTVCKFDKDHTPDEALIGYGGNSTILIWDNPDNADLLNPVGGKIRKSTDSGREQEGAGTGAIVRDHITIGTGHYKQVNLVPGQDIMGYYKFVPDPNGRYSHNGTQGYYVHQSSHILQDGESGEFFEIESDGGIYGGGRKVYVEGFRNCDLAYYGYADYTPQYPKLLNSAQRLDLFSITDCCLMMQGAVDFANNSIDATRYSMTRIGELEMRSSIDPNSSLEPGVRDNTALANVIHDKHRVRNYMAFFHDVLYLSAMTSSEAFTNPYRGANGKLGYIGNFRKDNGTDSDHSVSAAADYSSLNYATSPFSYRQYKANRIGNYYANRNQPNQISDGAGGSKDNTDKLVTSLEFDQRNLGTAANMIGINNGYTLKIQGAVVDDAGRDQIYYGPVSGVFEVKLMTLATDEGGGYIYALNQHDDPNHFLETTGNFVFPGAAYRMSSQSATAEETYNYVYDDCYPMGSGWDSYWGWNSADRKESTSSMGPGKHSEGTSTVLDSNGKHVCDDPEHGGSEVHFWYVNGSNFYFNVTLTAYTFNGKPQYFHLNNNEDLIYLYGINGNSDISLESAKWTPINEINTGGYKSDLRNVSDDDKKDAYQLFLSIDNKPGEDHTLGDSAEPGLRPAETDNHAFITRIPRADFSKVQSSDDSFFHPTDTINRYGTSPDNSPLLGITLFDKCDNASKDYYEDHLAKEELVRLVLKATDVNNLTFKYIINLTVKYIKGPVIDGFLKIENDALPGEYIYANAYDVNIDIDDENMGINSRNWYIVGKDCDISSNQSIKNFIDGIASGSKSAENINDQLINSTDRRQVHIPAYLYRDGWNVVYEIEANGISFFVTPAAQDPSQAALADDPAIDPMTAKSYFYPRLKVHNYHRMKPMVPLSDTVEDLRLSDGAWLYIEDDDDMAYFFEWLASLQSEDCQASINGGGIINPRFGKGLTVQLLTDVSMPSGINTKELRFDGVFHGNGHNIDMKDNSFFLGINAGKFYNTGFISSHDIADGAAVFDHNSGLIDCCFFFNDTKDKGELIDDANNSGSIVNCYTTSEQDSHHYSEGLSFASFDDFKYGRVAYGLNKFYLQKRYNLAYNMPDESDDPIIAKFHNGEYRFGALHSDDYPFLLRTASVPNYRDYLGIRINANPDEVSSGVVLGTAATMHDIDETIDMSRVVKDDAGQPLLTDGKEHYLPNFADDYIFFGQDLTFGSSDTYPHAAYASTRVYRASGFFGSKVDEGFHFNRNINVLNPAVTALDFSGVRDEQHPGFSSGRRNFTDANGDIDQMVWYGPQLDLPPLDSCSFEVSSRIHELNLINVPDKLVTRNLLVYRKSGTLPALDDFIYDTSTPFEDVYCHVIEVPDPTDSSDNSPNVDYIQLLDKEDFNAPIAFDVNNTIWYRRLPSVWANHSDGWEGICLPFTANTVYGSLSGSSDSRSFDNIQNHGLMTHFYGDLKSDCPAPDSNDYWTRETHEYWLRKFVGTDESGQKAFFERPRSNFDLKILNPLETSYDNYHFSNEYFTNVFGDLRYNEAGTEHVPQAYTAAGVDYKDYPMLTANYPYIVSFPGERYYEFDCSGEFYSKRTGNGDPLAQIITFAWDKDKAEVGSGKMHIDVSDGSIVVFEHNNHKFIGTFTRLQASSLDAVIDLDSNASTLVRPSASDQRIVLPFRAYLKCTDANPTPIPISSRSIDSIGPDLDPDSDSEELALHIYLDNHVLVIENPFDVNLRIPLCDVAGRILRNLEIAPGVNRYNDISQGIYLLNSFKFMIP